MVDLQAKPYYLDDDAIRWVETTIAAMTIEEKIGQLFINMGASRDEAYLKDVLERYHIGGVRYNPGPAAAVHEQNRILQENSKIPLLIAANTEAGGNGACTDGTEVGFHVKVAATGNPHYAYEMGRVAGVEASAVGCNWSFAPIVDINRNWRNPIISSRAFSQDPDLVLAMAKAYMQGINESGIVCAMKHYPGDGIDERDQHLCSSVNSLSCAEWDATFGKVYAGMIEAGVHSVMAGHIMLPAYSRHFNPSLADADLLPATLSKELITDLLKGKLGFNGLVITDASHMVGLTCAMKRRDLVPASIAAGIDMFLFFNDPDEDFGWMMDGYKSGVITEARLQDALTRILGVKASLGLHKKAKTEIVPPKSALERIGLPANKAIFAEVADKAITLVKNIAPSPLPISPEKYRRVLLVPQKGPDNPVGTLFGGRGPAPVDVMAEQLRAAGFAVSIFESAVEKLMKLPPEERGRAFMGAYADKTSISSLVSQYDLVIHVANVTGLFQPVQRISWMATKGTADIPWYVHEIPTIFVSVNCPFHLADAPQVKCYINTYDPRETTLKLLVEKLMGKSEFKGVSPVDAFCGMLDTRI
ncbi:MAG TPA: glycoside hydrolase family 3 N-terminal domain-containing protein [Anaerolineae bacterium]|nr:glycoside hydrolase family 3 N-terminal domain-containing protein [Anaerolineae bacterium]HQI85355.1 glycoside hydrolase family 3 N-terminal domain-containing protein [Anaerolineae bacterium]